jgi:hypothetical protein
MSAIRNAGWELLEATAALLHCRQVHTEGMQLPNLHDHHVLILHFE